MQCVVLAGGLATRLRPLTEKIPKAMLPAAGLPFVHHQLDWFAKTGVTDVVFCIGYLGEQIQNYVGNGSKWGLKVSYCDEGEKLQGTGGALRKAFEAGLLRDDFLVTYGDSYLPIDFKSVWQAHKKSGLPALMVVLENQERWDSSNACFDGRKVTHYEKIKDRPKPKEMRFIDYGLSALSCDLVEKEVPSGQVFDLAQLFHKLSQSGLLAGFETKTRFYEIGSQEGLKEFSDYILGKKD